MFALQTAVTTFIANAMDIQVTPQTKPSNWSRRYWLRTAATAVFAALVSVAVSAIARNQLWPHPESIAFGVFLFLIPVLQSVADRRRVQNWPLRLAASLAGGIIGGLIYAWIVET